MEDTISIIEGVLDERIKGNWDVEIDLEKIDEHHKNACKKLNTLLKNQKKSTRLSFERESDIRRTFLEIGRLCGKLMKGDLSQRVNLSTFPSDIRPAGMSLNKVFNRLQENIEELQQRELDLKTAVSAFGSVLSSASKGDLSAKVAPSQISEEYRTIGENINSMIEETGEREEELKDAQAYTQALIRKVPLPMSLMDEKRVRIDVNEAFEKSYMHSREEAIELPIEKLYVEEDIPKIKDALAKCRKEDYSSCEATTVRGDGIKMPVIISFSAVRDREGNIINIMGTATDITELKTSQENMSKIVESSPAAMVLLDEEGRWIMFNRAAEKIFGFSSEEVLGKKTPEQACTMPETIEALKKLWRFVVEQREEALRGVDVPWRTKDGRIVIHRAYEIPFGKGEGRLYAGIDITEMREREEELKESNEFNQLLIENLPVVIWMSDEEGKCCLANKELTRLLGWEKEEVMGKLSSESPYVCESGLPYMKEGTVEALSKIWKKTLEKKELAMGEVPFLTKDGRVVTHRGVEIPYGKGEARLWTSVDITEPRKREEELKQAVSAFGSVLSKAAGGDLSAMVEEELTGSLKEVGEDINEMVQGLVSIVGGVKDASGQLSTSSRGILSSADQMTASAQQVSQSISQISEGASVQATKLTEVKKSTEDMMQMTQTTAKEAKSMAETMKGAAEKAVKGASDAQDAIERSEEMSSTMDQTVQVVSSLGEKLTEVGSVLEIIRGVAAQTNLLALNAAIEATRAGEHGRAFAVVAEEVRKLAERSREHTKQIGGMIKEIDEGREEAMVSVDKAAGITKESKEVIHGSLLALEDIASLVQAAAATSQGLLDASRRQEEEIGRVSSATGEVTGTGQEMAANVQELSASTQELTASMEELSVTSQELTQLSTDLDESVTRFRVEKL